MHIKLKGVPIVCLVGFMGCGKSTVGKLLAERLGWAFVDLDEEIEHRSGMAIADIFERKGEGHFRELEHEVFQELWSLSSKGKPQVMALGGGTFHDPRNRDRLELGGVSIWLDCSLEKLWGRVTPLSNRPLARGREQFEQLYRGRLPQYGLADFRVPGDADDPRKVVEAILELPLFK